MEDVKIDSIKLEKIKSELQDIHAMQLKVVEKVITTHIDAFQLSCREFDMIINRIHDIVCQCDQEVKNAIKHLEDDHFIADETTHQFKKMKLK